MSYEPRVTLRESSGALRMHPKSAAALLPQEEIAPDWKGQLSVPAATAQRHEQAREAGLRFELREPLLPFGKWLQTKAGATFR
jgi:hypothetical protein